MASGQDRRRFLLLYLRQGVTVQGSVEVGPVAVGQGSLVTVQEVQGVGAARASGASGWKIGRNLRRAARRRGAGTVQYVAALMGEGDGKG